MKIYESNFDYKYSFHAVSLAYFLRYPNPYSRHVLSSDVIDRYVDPETQRLHTLRLHLKRSKVPAGILRLLPRGLAGPGGASESYILEKSTIDAKEGWMETESRNLEWTGILSVIERQSFRRADVLQEPTENQTVNTAVPSVEQRQTSCRTTVTFISRFGQPKFLNRKTPGGAEEAVPKQSFWAAWSTAGIQRTIEALGMNKAQSALVNGKEGMNVVLQRMRSGGVIAVLEGMRRDRLEIAGGDGGLFSHTLPGAHEGLDRSLEDDDD